MPRDAPAQAPCDPALPRNEAQSSGYRLRGDRCEGVYRRPVASFGIQLVSLTASNPVDLCGSGAVHMVWPAATAVSGAGPIHVQAESLRPLLYCGSANGIVTRVPAGYGLIDSGRSADLSQPGLYRARASVEFETGAVETIEFHFLHGR